MSAKSDKLFQRRKAVTKASLERRTVNREQNTRILIVCEGEKTERLYIQSVVDLIGPVATDVEIFDECPSAPGRIVEFARERAEAEGSSERGGYDKVFCVFDRDTHSTFEAARSRVQDINKSTEFPAGPMTAITSIPCLEYWFILHCYYTRRPFASRGKKTASQEVIAELRRKKGFKDYEKNLKKSHISILLPQTDKAISNARTALKDMEKTGEENPSTLMHLLIVALRETKKKEQSEAKKSL